MGQQFAGLIEQFYQMASTVEQGMIKISDKTSYKWTFNCGPGPNTRAELLGVWATLILATRLHIY